MNSKSAFTLAEVIITLTIVGVVAAMVIPPVVQNTRNYQNVVMLQKFYSDFQQVFTLVQAENSGSIVPVFQKDTTTNYGNGYALNTFLAKMNYIKNCGNGKGCWYDTPLYLLNGSISSSKFDTDWNSENEKAILANGAMVVIEVYSVDCNYIWGSGPLNKLCALLDVDINGAKGPNKIGRDFFQFYITQTGIYPAGTFDDGKYCIVSPNDWSNSVGCTAEVLHEGAMNY